VYITTIVDKQHRVMVSYPVSYHVSYQIKTDLTVYTTVVMNLTAMASDVDFITAEGILSLSRCKGPDATCLYL